MRRSPTARDNLTFACFTVASWSPSYPMHVTFTPVTSVVAGRLSVVKGTSESPAGRR